MRFSYRTAGGFTLTELVVVIVIMAILAVFAASRFSSQSFNTRGFTDQTLAMLRYAQKTAVSQRRTVCVSIAGNVISLSYLVPPGGNTTCPGTAISQPGGLVGGGGAFSATAPSGVTLSLTGTTSPFSFSPLGQPSSSVGTPLTAQLTVTIVGDVTNAITVEQETGYVH
ncbi:MAG TPA: GspH/FimT family pseudopilin [Steroidobacteraceae bacterium]|jgi:MSHA pilin protein MshC